MALIKCKDCGKEYSTDAKACVHCGANRPDEHSGKAKGCLSPFLLMVVAIPVLGAIFGGPSRESRIADEKQHPEKYVLGTCMSFTKDSLHDPSGAEFDYPYPSATALPADKYSMTLSLRAKNGFNAMRHFAVECVIRFNGNSWSLVSLKEVR
jgi:hypothetical protein